jgi:hypothetical protein
VIRCDITGNGTTGAGFKASSALISDSSFSGNSRQADVSEYYGWDYGGFKLGESSNVSFRNVVADNNYGIGMWIDSANVGILLEGCQSSGNTTAGIFIENNNGNNIPGLGSSTTVELRSSVFSNNMQTSPANSTTGRGIYITESENVIIDDCMVYGNEAQLRVADSLLRGPIDNVQISNSSFICLDAGQDLIETVNATSWTQFITSYSASSDNNSWYTPASTIAFPDASRAITLNLAAWKSLVGAETNSIWGVSLVDISLETSTDQLNWAPADEGTYDDTNGEIFFRANIEQAP